jgi:nucleoside-diphosphate-sugar epimerase
MLSGEKILITGVTGMVPLPIADFLARENEVWGVARFTNREARAQLDAKGITTRAIDLGRGELGELPEDFSYVIHCAHTRMGAGEFVPAIQVNAVGAGRVLQHCRRAKAALVVSSGAVYSPRNDDVFYPFKEGDDIGRAFAPWAPTSPVSKVSLEAVARFCAEGFGLRTTIVRLNVVYGPLGGMPVMDLDRVAAGQPILTFADPYPSNPIHAGDMCDQLEALLAAARTPATIVNWCGDEVVTQRQWSERAGELAGRPVQIQVTPVPGAPCGSVGDAERRRSLTGPCKRKFWDEFDALYRARHGAGR